MAIPLLQTKLYLPPPQPGWVHRPRLTELINEGLTRKLTLISAPAGFGKTTLLSEWVQTSPYRVSWLSLEGADNDPTRFWTYFMAALELIDEDLVKDARDFLYSEGQQSKLLQLESFLTILLNGISNFPDEFILVLDDYQHINNQAIHEAIIFLIYHLPPRMHLMITCRADPPLTLARLRAKGQMVELRADDLRFTSDEVMIFLNQSMGLNLSADQIAALEVRTEGWIAGLQLAAISMQRRADASGFIESFTGSHRFILDYLVDEVLSCQPEDLLSFLLETSILDRFTGPLCDWVTGRDDSRETLEQLEQANLFIIPLDNERHWYRYHHLFADLLRSRLQELKPNQIKVLHQRACEWLELERLLPEAVSHALIVSDFEKAAQLIERAAETLRQQGEIATLTNWMNALPAAFRRSRPALCIAYARAMVDSAQPKAVEALITDAQSDLKTLNHPDDLTEASLRGKIAALEAYLEVTRNHFDQAVELSQRARQLLAEGDPRWSSFIALNLAQAYRFTSNWAAAGQAYLEASTQSQEAGDKVNALIALSLRGEVSQAQGHHHQSVLQFEQVLQLAQEFGIPSAPVTGLALIGLGRTWYEWNDLEAAFRYVKKGLDCGKKAGMLDVLLRGYIVVARIRQAQGDPEGELEALENTRQVAHQIGTSEVKDWVDAFRAQAWLARGETEAAVNWANTLHGDIQDSVYPSIAIAIARIKLAQGHPDEALRLLEHAFQSANAFGRIGNAVQILVVLAMVQQSRGSLDDAYTTLSKALIGAEPEGYLRVFLDEGEPMRLLISNFRLWAHASGIEKQKISADYIDKLLSAFMVPSISPVQKPIIINLHLSIPEPLSEREIEVMRMIVAGLSNREIADKDVVSINTVKTQVKSIYGKLGVHHREDAIAAAHELHLI